MVTDAVVSGIIFEEDSEHKEQLLLLKKQKSELENKLKKCKVKFGMDEIDEDIYTTTVEVMQEKLAKIEVEIAKVKRNLSNLTSTADEVLATCCKLGSLWGDSELELCQKIQNLLFPSGIFWDKENDNYRTFDCNQALSIIQRISDSYKNKNEEKSENFSSNFKMCHIVPDYRTFIDDYLKILDFIKWLKVAYPEKAEFLTKK